MLRNLTWIAFLILTSGCSVQPSGGDKSNTSNNSPTTQHAAPDTEVADADSVAENHTPNLQNAEGAETEVDAAAEATPEGHATVATETDDASYGFSAEELQALGLADLASDAATGSNGTPEENPMAGCLQCHVNSEASHHVSAHFREAEMSCIDCHGPSEGHVGNENNDVPPDEVFARKDVDRLCSECHNCSCSRRRPTATDEALKVCTDCHPAHGFPISRDEIANDRDE